LPASGDDPKRPVVASRFITLSTMVVFGAVALVHVYWALGGRRGSAAAVPSVSGRAVITPGHGVTLVVATLLFMAAAVLGLRAGIVNWPGLPSWIPAAGTWTAFAVMLLRFVGDFRYVGLFKRVVGTPFATLDTKVYSPLCFALALGCACTALAAHAE